MVQAIQLSKQQPLPQQMTFLKAKLPSAETIFKIETKIAIFLKSNRNHDFV